MRLFVSIPMTHSMKQSLTELQNEMVRKDFRGNFTRKENFHMTVAFIGEYEDSDAVLRAMERVPVPYVTLELTKLGHFGQLYWAGTRENPKLEEYALALRNEFRKDGIPFDPHPFLAHITVARRVIAPKDAAVTVPRGHMEFRHVCLMVSERGEDGNVFYREIGRVTRK